MTVIKPLGFGIYELELIEKSSVYRTTGYLILGEKKVLIETGATRSNGAIQTALKELNIDLKDIDAIIVTHIHLDHSGGAGLLMSQCPNAVLLAHEKAKPHLSDPEKLIQGARVVYGDSFDKLFSPILPISEERIQVMGEEDKYDLGNGRIIHFYNSPGHAFHHHIIHDPISNGIFSGDAAGLFFNRIYEEYGIKYVIPVTAPTQFAPNLMVETLEKMIRLNPDRIYYTHFGMSNSGVEMLQAAKKRMDFFGRECIEFYKKDRSFERLNSFMNQRVFNELEQSGVPHNLADRKHIMFDITLNAQGVVALVERQEREAVE